MKVTFDLVNIFILSYFVCFSCSANWYISPFGNNNNSGTSASSPLLYLTNALTKASQGDTINVAAGLYVGANNVGLKVSGVKIVGTSGSAATIFQGTPTTPVIFQLNNNANLIVIFFYKKIFIIFLHNSLRD